MLTNWMSKPHCAHYSQLAGTLTTQQHISSFYVRGRFLLLNRNKVN